jgi:hypothetical protein
LEIHESFGMSNSLLFLKSCGKIYSKDLVLG